MSEEKFIPFSEGRHLSHSHVGNFKSCHTKWQLRYEHDIRPKETARGRSMGKVWTGAIEVAYDPEPTLADGLEFIIAEYLDKMNWAATQAEVDELENQEAILRALLPGYILRYPQPMQREIGYELPIPGSDRLWRGEIDGLMDDRLVEDKLLTPRFWNDASILQLKIDEQVTEYAYAGSLLGLPWEKSEYRVTMKPALQRRKVRQPETRREFIDRVTADIAARPDVYYRCYVLERTAEDLEAYESEKTATVKAMEEASRVALAGTTSKNTGSCTDYGGCEYLGLCTQSRLDGYRSGASSACQ